MMTALILILGLLGHVESYVPLTAAAQKKFEKTKGASQAEKSIALTIDGSALDRSNVRLFPGRDDWILFEHRGVTYYAEKSNPYLGQTQRKLESKKAKVVLVKGKVTSIVIDGEKIWALQIHTAQAMARKPPKARKNEKPAAADKTPASTKTS